MMSPDGEKSGFIVISRNSNVAMPVTHRARLPPLLLPLQFGRTLRVIVWVVQPATTVAAPSAGATAYARDAYVRERVGGFWRASVRPAGRRTHLHYSYSCVSIIEGTFPASLLQF